MYGPEISPEQQAATGKYTVTLASVGDPDHGQDPDKCVPGVGSITAYVNSMAEASRACRTYIDGNGLGGGNWAGGAIELDGKAVANVSYNGRVWGLPDPQGSASPSETSV